MERSHTPFPAIVGQEELKQALLAVMTNDALDGLLVSGEKGTAKSTAVRGVAELLPDQQVIEGCPYGCPPNAPARQCAECREHDPDEQSVTTRPVPLVTLPLGATRDRVCGTLSVSDALDGEVTFDPGLLAAANRGILYVDEVNLLDDHLVDVILDAAASGINRVERDGMSISHPAEFTLVGTMNPEEGELRPQLRDRFALQATVEGAEDPDDRMQIIDRAVARERNEDALREEFAAEVSTLQSTLLAARERLGSVTLGEEHKRQISELCLDAGVDGHRGDIAMAETAMTLAALDGREVVQEADLITAARLALPHRLQSHPFDDAPDVEEVLEKSDLSDEESGSDAEESADGDSSSEESQGEDTDGTDSEQSGDGESGGGEDVDSEGKQQRGGTDGTEKDSSDGTDEEETAEGGDEHSEITGETSAADIEPEAAGDGKPEGDEQTEGEDQTSGDGSPEEHEPASPRESAPLVPGQRQPVGEAEQPDVPSLDIDETGAGDGSRADTAPSPTGRGPRVRTEPTDGTDPVDPGASVRAAATAGRTSVSDDDLRTSVRQSTSRALIIFVVDASASMRGAMADAKGTVLSLLTDAYEQRDEVAFIAVTGEEATLLLPPTDSVTLAARHLKELPTGDRTPLPSGLRTAADLIQQRETTAAVVVTVTDGKATVESGSPTTQTREAARRLARTDATVVLVDASDGPDRTGLLDIIQHETDATRMPLSSLSADAVFELAQSRE